MTPTRNPAVLGSQLLDRPLTPRSVIASLLLGTSPPRLSGARLVRWCGLFGIAEGTTRVALSRMVERGELRAAGGVYELAGRVGARRPAQDWSLRPRCSPWDGEWRAAVVGAGARSAADRARLRDAMRRLRCAQLREGVWTRPANLPRASAPDDAWAVADAQVAWWTGRPDEAPGALARRLFAPERWARRASELEGLLAAATRRLATGDDEALAVGFVTGAAVLAHVRADPLLPPELCPPRWPGGSLRAAYEEYRAAFGPAVGAFFRSAVTSSA